MEANTETYNIYFDADHVDEAKKWLKSIKVINC